MRALIPLLALSLFLSAAPVSAAQVCKYDSIRATAPASRFTDNGDGTVTDTATGLIWKRCSEGQSWDGATCTGTASTHTWQQALQLADGASFAGHDDWRLPNVKELASITELACESPAIEETVFPRLPEGLAWWTSTPSAWVLFDGIPRFVVIITRNGSRYTYSGDGAAIIQLVRGSPVNQNDTGMNWWSTQSSRRLGAEPEGFPGQDASVGRDADHNDDSDGINGFSFTKLDANGNELDASASDWSCIKDNVTSLIWEAKTDDAGLHNKDWLYTWYNDDPASNGGNAGSPDPGNGPAGAGNSNSCFDPARCDTNKFVADVNNAGFCGANDWRIPSREELRSLSDYATADGIDRTWFPHAFGTYWSSSTIAGRVFYVWGISVSTAFNISEEVSKSGSAPVRLVRGGQILPPFVYSITPQSTPVSEADGSVSFTITRSDSTSAQTLYASTVPNQGSTNNGDYTGKFNEPVVFAAGETQKTVTVQINDDLTLEGDETFGLILQQSPSDPITTFLAAATFTILDNDTASQPPVVDAITPTTVTRNHPSFFKVAGSHLPVGLVFNLNGCAPAPEQAGGTDTLRQFSCIPTQAGNFMATVTDAQGNAVAGGSATVNVVAGVENPPERIDISGSNNLPTPPPGAPQRKAVVITHGWNATAGDWVLEMAKAICRNLGSTSPFATLNSVAANGYTGICTAGEWDVWVWDWRDHAAPIFWGIIQPLDVGFFSFQASANAYDESDKLAHWISALNYQHFHFIAHSAGSNLINNAMYRLGDLAFESHRPRPTIQASFLDAYDPFKSSSLYGLYADWADNYVDTRTLWGDEDSDDGTKLFLDHAHNIDVTPYTFLEISDPCNVFTDIDAICRHSRPYRFYGLSIDDSYVGDDDYKAHDPVEGTDSVGFRLSTEKGLALDILKTSYKPGEKCVMDGDVCYIGSLPPGLWHYLPGAFKDTTVAIVNGAVDIAVDTGAIIADTAKLGWAWVTGGVKAQTSVQPTLSAAGTSKALANLGAETTELPSWVVVEVTTTGPINTLRFDWRFATGGDGVLQVFVDDLRVRMLEQRFVPIASLRTENLAIGELLPGTHQIAFRLDGFGANPSGIELTDVELGWEERVSRAADTQVLNVITSGPGKVNSVPDGIDCGANCSAAFTNGQNAQITALTGDGAHFVGWSGDCSGSGVCYLKMDANKKVFAIFAEGQAADKSVSGKTSTGSGDFSATLQGGGANCAFDLAQTGALPLPAPPPTGTQFPNGLFQFRLVGCTPNSTVTLRVRWPGQAGGQYWKFNPRTSQWYPYPGASFNPFTSTWTLQITDNGPHDADPTPGVILDPTGPAQQSVTGPGGPGNPGASAQPIPTLSPWMLGALVGLLGLLVFGAYRSRVGG